MKKQLIKETEPTGVVWYFVQVDGSRISPFTHEYNEALNHFNQYGKAEPSKEVILEAEINQKNK